MFALIKCNACKDGAYSRKRGDSVPCKSCNGTGVYYMVEFPPQKYSIPNGANLMINVNGKKRMAKAYDPIADILNTRVI